MLIVIIFCEIIPSGDGLALSLTPVCFSLSLSLQHQMDPSSNFYNYRTALRGATQRSITANSSREKVRMMMMNTDDLFT